MNFGTFIKNKRLAMKLGLRIFAEMIGEDAGNWCRVETGKFPAPNDLSVLNKICEVLKIKEKEKFYDLASKFSRERIPADIKHQICENEIVPILFRTIDKKNLSKTDLKKLAKRIEDEY